MRIQEYRIKDTRTQVLGYKNTGFRIQGYMIKDTRIQVSGYKDLRIQGYRFDERFVYLMFSRIVFVSRFCRGFAHH